jgi:hypothetical protein
MRQIAPNEIQAINKMLQAETNGLAMARVALHSMTDDALISLTKTSIDAGEARIRALQQFIMENDIVREGAVQ